MTWWIQVIAADLLVIAFGFAAIGGAVWALCKFIQLCSGVSVGDATGEVHEWNPERGQRED